MWLEQPPKCHEKLPVLHVNLWMSDGEPLGVNLWVWTSGREPLGVNLWVDVNYVFVISTTG